MLSDEEKKAINDLNFIIVTDIYDNEVSIDKTKIINEYNKSVGIALNLIKKQSIEIEEYKKQLDLDYVDKHFVPIERYNQLEKEIEKLKEKNKKYTIHLTDKQYKDCIKLAQSDALYKFEAKIKAKIEELDYNDISNFERRCKQEILQSFLEKE